jgi:hypothetical protein
MVKGSVLRLNAGHELAISTTARLNNSLRITRLEVAQLQEAQTRLTGF